MLEMVSIWDVFQKVAENGILALNSIELIYFLFVGCFGCFAVAFIFVSLIIGSVHLFANNLSQKIREMTMKQAQLKAQVEATEKQLGDRNGNG